MDKRKLVQMILETERLILREITIADAPFIFELMNSEGWLKYIGDRGIQTLQDAENYIEDRMRKSYTEYGFGFYTMERKADKASIGISGIVKRSTLPHIDIGFGMLPQFGKQGYAYEASKAIQNYAHNVLKIEKLVAITLPTNENSIRLLKKLGLHFERMIQFEGDEDTLMLFSE